MPECSGAARGTQLIMVLVLRPALKAILGLSATTTVFVVPALHSAVKLVSELLGVCPAQFKNGKINKALQQDNKLGDFENLPVPSLTLCMLLAEN